MSRRSLLTVFWLFLWSAHGSQVNLTIDDSDPSIVYSPSTSWNSSKVVCSSCNNPPVALAVQQTFHKGVHTIVLDGDDNQPPPPPPPNEDDHDHDSDDNPGRRDLHLPRLDSDDAGFADTPVFAQFNFTGTAVYIYCIQPLGLAKAPAPPSQMNITFSIDNTTSSAFLHQGSASGSGFASGVNIFAKQGLTAGPHSMKLSLGDNSVLILDYIVVTQNTPDSSSPSGTLPFGAQNTASSPDQSALSSPSAVSDSDEETTKKDRASFGAVIGGVVGAFGLLSFGTAFSIYRRRLLAARRDRLERGDAPPPSFLTNPASFVPRYFPGTILQATPPAYTPSVATASSSSQRAAQLAASEPLLVSPQSSDDRELPEPHIYSDDVPPPPEEDVPPPSFGVAITTPAVTLLSSDDAANPPPRPMSWDHAPHTIPLPDSNAASRGTSRGPSLFTAENAAAQEDDDDFIGH